MRMLSPLAVVCIGVFFTSFSAVFVRGTEAPALITAMYRMWFSVFLLVPLMVTKRFTAGRRAQKKGRPANSPVPVPTAIDWALCVLSGFFLAAHFWMWFASLDLTSIASSTVLVDTHPLFTLVFGFLLLKEKVPGKAIIFIFVAIAGVAILSFGDLSRGSDTFSGDLLALGGAAAVSGYVLIGRKVRQRMDALTYVLLVYLTSAVTLTCFAMATGVPLFAYSLTDYLLFIGIAFFCTILGHTLLNWALKYLKAAFLSMIVLTEPLFATILGMLIFREIPGLSTAAGALIVLFGLFMFVREEGKVTGGSL